MTLDLLELRALADLATPAPWFARGRHLSRVPNDYGMGATLHTNHIGIVSEADDAAFIAAARSAVPALLDRVAELEARLRDALAIAALFVEADGAYFNLEGSHQADALEEGGERHDIGLREAECVCTWEQGDSQCPAHPTCNECGCVVCECAIDAAGVGGES